MLRAIANAPRVVKDSAFEYLADNWGKLFASLGICLGGIVVAWILIRLAECYTRRQSTRRWDKDSRGLEKTKWKQKTGHSSYSLARLVAMLLGILAITIAFWIAANMAGFNFWSVVLGYGIISLIVTYAFGQPLRDGGAFLLIALTDKIEESWWVEIVGMGVEGRITAIHLFWVEIEYLDDNGNMEEAHIPTGYIMSNVLKRKFYRESESNYLLDPNTNKPLVKKRLKDIV